MRSVRHFFRFAKCLTLLLVWASVAEACPGCKEALFEPGKVSQLISTARGYALSIGLMLLVPASLIACLALLIIRSARRQGRTASPPSR